MMPSPSGSGDAQPSFGSGGRPSSFSFGHLSASPMMPSPSGSVDLHPSFGSGGRPSSFSLRHLSVPSSGTPSPSASGGFCGSTGTGFGGSGGRHPVVTETRTASATAIERRFILDAPPRHHERMETWYSSRHDFRRPR